MLFATILVCSGWGEIRSVLLDEITRFLTWMWLGISWGQILGSWCAYFRRYDRLKFSREGGNYASRDPRGGNWRLKRLLCMFWKLITLLFWNIWKEIIAYVSPVADLCHKTNTQSFIIETGNFISNIFQARDSKQYFPMTWSGYTDTVKPVYNDHLMGYFSAFWSSSMWPRAT